MKLEDILKEEIANLSENLKNQVTDPAEKLAILQMTNDLAMLPIRMARGEDVSIAVKNLKAEAALRGVRHSMAAQAAVQQAWMNIIFKVMGAAITAAI